MVQTFQLVLIYYKDKVNYIYMYIIYTFHNNYNLLIQILVYLSFSLVYVLNILYMCQVILFQLSLYNFKISYLIIIV